MQSTGDSGRLPAAPSLGTPIGTTDPPRTPVVVEVWVAKPRVAVARPLVPPSERRGVDIRVPAAAAVVALHASLGAWLLLPHSPRPIAPVPEPLVLLQTPPAARAEPAPIAAELPPPEFVRITPTPPKLPQLPTGPVEIAVSITSATDVLISDARAGDVADLVGNCRAPAPQALRPVRSAAEITLLVHVEKDGRVSDSKIEVGSGVAHVDEAIQRCLAARGSLTPRRINGSAVASWQRVRWPAA